ncbi:hypothetical protein SAMN05192544_1001428 [Paraburkholderia hospita]|nr:hypothetical protein SAMN05192544_1001428 [Paraburkholderia hospita]
MSNELYLVLDESLAKGRASKEESFDGEFGVIAGYFVRGNNIERTRQALESIRSGVSVSGKKKLHITDAAVSEQEHVRQNVFGCFDDRELSLIYEAVYVQGLHNDNKRTNESIQQVRDSRRSNISIPWRAENERLLSVAFDHVFGKAVAYAFDFFDPNVHLSVITDTLDEKILDEFRQRADNFLSLGEPKEIPIKAYDREKKEPIELTGRSSMTGDIDKFTKRLRNVTYSIACENSSLTFAADVLVNSVGYQLTKNIEAKGRIDLNSRPAIVGHRLEHYFYGVTDETTMRNPSDTIYRHPGHTD